MNKDLTAIFEYLEREKGINRSVVVDAIRESLCIAAQKSIEGASNVSVTIDDRTGNIEVYCEKVIADTVENAVQEISLEGARELDPDCEVGQFIDVLVTPKDFGRIAAQKARQVITQKLRTAERDVIYEAYRDRVHEIVSGTVKRIARGGTLIVDLGKVEALLPMRNYPKTERYQVGNRVLALLQEVQESENGGAEVILSRSDPEFVRQLFMQEVPEISDGTVTIEKIVREAGYRTKILVKSNDIKVDPVGACVGMRGTRVKNIVRELNNEKIDIIPYAEDPVELLQNSLAPVEISKFWIDEDQSVMAIIVQDDDFAVVIGKRGMNARLTGRLLGMELEVQKMTDHLKTIELQKLELLDSGDSWLDEEFEEIEGINALIVDNLLKAQYNTPRAILSAELQDLVGIDGVSIEMANKIVEQIQKQRN